MPCLILPGAERGVKPVTAVIGLASVIASATRLRRGNAPQKSKGETTMRLILIAVLGGLLFANGAAAQDSQNPLDTRIFKNGWWVGGGVGWSAIDADDITLDDDDFGFNVGLGYQFLNYFGVNVRYRDLGEFSDTIPVEIIGIDKLTYIKWRVL